MHCSSVNPHSSRWFQQRTSLSPLPILPAWELFVLFCSNKHTSLSLLPISPVWRFFVSILQCMAHWLQLIKRFSLRFRFEIYKQFNFVGQRPELSQDSIFKVLLHQNCTVVLCPCLLSLLTTQIQQCSCTDLGPSPTQRSHSYSDRFNPVFLFWIVCVTFRPTE